MPQRTFLQNRWNFSHFYKFSNTKAQKMQTGPLKQAIKYDCNNKSKENKSKKQFSSGSQNWLLLCNKYLLNISPAELGGRKANLVTDMQSYEQLEVKKLGIFRPAHYSFYLLCSQGWERKKLAPLLFLFSATFTLQFFFLSIRKKDVESLNCHPPSLGYWCQPVTAFETMWEEEIKILTSCPSSLLTVSPHHI